MRICIFMIKKRIKKKLHSAGSLGTAESSDPEAGLASEQQ